MITKLRDKVGSAKQPRKIHTVNEDEEEEEEMHPGICGQPSCASYLWWPWTLVVKDPRETGIVFVLITFIFGAIGKCSTMTANVITWYGVLILLLFGLWLFILFAARALAFPGHLALVKRQLENEVTKRASKLHVDALNDATVGLLQLDTNSSSLSLMQFLSELKIIQYHFQENLMVSRRVLSKVNTVHQLSSSASTYLSALDDLLTLYEENFQQDINELLNSTSATSPSSSISSSSTARHVLISNIENKRNVLTRYVRNLTDLQSSLFYVEPEEEEENDEQNMENGGNTNNNTNDTENSSHWLIKICKNLYDFIVSWRAARAPLDTVINMAYLRYELLERYNAVEGWAGGDVDSIYFPPRNNSTTDTDTDNDSNSNNDQPIVPTKIVVICFPNAGILEFVHYQSDWLPFYLSQDFAVVMTNYRGYGSTSTYGNGLPSPSVIKNDGGRVIEQLVAKYSSARIMVHGESMGGMVACALAAKYPLHVSLAYVDRTFANLPKVGSTLLKLNFVAKYGPWILPWKTNNVSDWLSITCPKLCANDPNDKMIAEASSLKEGISEELTKRAIEQHDPWATDERRLLPLWNDDPTDSDGNDDDNNNDNNDNNDDDDGDDDNHSSKGQAAERLLGGWNALKSLLMAHACQDSVLVRKVLRHVHNLDGRQNKTLGTAMGEGLESIRSWSKTLLIFGAVSIVPDEQVRRSEMIEYTMRHLQQRGMSPQEAARVALQNVDANMPVSLEEVYQCIQEAMIKGAAGEHGKEAMENVGQVIADLHLAYKAREEELQHAEANDIRAELGTFLPLRCGHNNALKKDEMRHVKEFLSEHGWL